MKKNTNARHSAASCLEDPTVRAILAQLPSDTDPNGSYTGRPTDGSLQPVQDADDL